VCYYNRTLWGLSTPDLAFPPRHGGSWIDVGWTANRPAGWHPSAVSAYQWLRPDPAGQRGLALIAPAPATIASTATIATAGVATAGIAVPAIAGVVMTTVTVSGRSQPE